MALSINPISCRLQLQLDYGVDEAGRAISRSKSYSNVKPDASNQDIFDTAMAIAGLQSYPVTAVRRIDQSELVEA
ncbi:MAG: DUF1659 domain-containing protein [Caldicoprobacterales bacterium]|jgi:hypothetical protein|nr:DUF1659 domain-containing protein [Clostridia bacterium]NLH58079.1 DUF1659 domain-containing protein [Clostridiales bacterium]